MRFWNGYPDYFLSAKEKVELVANDILEQFIIANKQKPNLDSYSPGKQVLDICNNEEVESILLNLQSNDALTYEKIDDIHYSVKPNWDNFRSLFYFLREDPSGKSTTTTKKKYSLDEVFSVLYINGIPIKLGRGIGERTLQYQTCRLCLEKPNEPIDELDILNAYKDSFDFARSRAVRDAVIVLNKKIKEQTKIDNIFIYSKATVTFNSKF